MKKFTAIFAKRRKIFAIILTIGLIAGLTIPALANNSVNASLIREWNGSGYNQLGIGVKYDSQGNEEDLGNGFMSIPKADDGSGQNWTIVADESVLPGTIIIVYVQIQGNNYVAYEIEYGGAGWFEFVQADSIGRGFRFLVVAPDIDPDPTPEFYIAKEVTNYDGDPVAFTFKLTFDDGDVATVEVFSDSSEKITLPEGFTGSVTVSEIKGADDDWIYDEAGYTLNFDKGVFTGGVDTDDDGNIVVSFENDYDPYVPPCGSLTIKKIWKLNDGEADDSFEAVFDIVSEKNDYTDTITINGNGKAPPITGLPYGDYTITETKIVGFSTKVDVNDRPGRTTTVTIGPDQEDVTVVYINKENPPPSDPDKGMAIIYKVKSTEEAVEEGEFAFDLYTVNNEGNLSDEPIDRFYTDEFGAVIATDLELGEYVFVEVGKEKWALDNYIDGVFFSIVMGEGRYETNYMFDNENHGDFPTVVNKPIPDPEVGNLTISKVWVLNNGEEADERFEAQFIIECEDPEYSDTITIFGNGEYPLDGLPYGEYTITETEIDGYSTKVGDEDGRTVTVFIGPDNVDVTVVYTNTADTVFSLVVNKTFSGVTALPANFRIDVTADLEDFDTITLAIGDDYYDADTFTTSGVHRWIITGLAPDVVYTATERNYTFTTLTWSGTASGSVELTEEANMGVITLRNSYGTNPPPPVDPPPVDPPPVTPPPPPPPVVTVIEEPEVPQTNVPEEEPVVEIEEAVEIIEPDVPLANLPQTGLSMLYQVLLFAGAALVGLGVAAGFRSRKRVKNDRA